VTDPSREQFVIADAGGELVIDIPARAPAEPLGRDTPIRLSVKGTNPLGGALPTGEVTSRTLALNAADEPFPDAIWQVIEFFRASRAGDLVVCAAPGFDLRSRFEYQPHRGSHGCLDRAHMLVPAAVNARWGEGAIRSVDLFPSILAALGRPVPPDLDGEPVPITAT
jgi:hypothetical protein